MRYLTLAVVLMLVMSACGGKEEASNPAAEEAILPEFVQSAPPRVKDAYLYAVSNPEELKNYPCFCGCGAMGHTSNLSCYAQNIAPDGRITFDNHASGCGICVDITQDVIRLKAQGKSSVEVRATIDAQYSQFGPGTNTPLPQD